LGPLSSIAGEPPDPDRNVLFLIQVQCDLCGYVMLFNSEKLSAPPDRVLVSHEMTPEMEREAEASGLWDD
jgi:hypothetical protein